MKSIKTFTPDEVTQAIESNRGLLLVHFGSTLASSSDFVRQEMTMLAGEFEGRIRFAEVETPLQDYDLIQAFEIEEIPTLIAFHDSLEVERLGRIYLPDELRELLEMACSFYGPSAEGSPEPAQDADRTESAGEDPENRPEDG